jgi:hypothetical protein
MDLRVNDDGQKYSISTELYFSGDSVGLYGRGYLGKGAFKGNIINGMVTIYFSRQNEYFTGPLADIGHGAECAGPGEVLLVALSLLTGKDEAENSDDFVYPSNREVKYHSGRFDRTIKLRQGGFPKSEKLIDPACRDSIVIKYYSFSRKYPFYKIEDALYYNETHNFRAKSFIREQKYNIDLKPKKFIVNIPPSAVRLESL